MTNRIDTPTMQVTIETALELSEIVRNILNDTSLNEQEQRKLIDAVLSTEVTQ